MNGSDSAFPVPSDGPMSTGRNGMDLRTYIATKAMAAMMNAEWCAHSQKLDPKQVARESCVFADALIAELSKS